MIDFFDYTNENKPAKGKLLLSEPFLGDPNFDRTVVLLCEHNGEGSFGFVLNKPSSVELNDIMEELNSFDGIAYVGGPVQHNTLHYIHRFPTLEGGQEILNGLYWGGEFEQLLLLLDTQEVTNEDIRFFVGYSGWNKGQLEEELEKKSWIVADLDDIDVVFERENDEMWKKVLRSLGGKFNIYSNYPADPRLN